MDWLSISVHYNHANHVGVFFNSFQRVFNFTWSAFGHCRDSSLFKMQAKSNYYFLVFCTRRQVKRPRKNGSLNFARICFLWVIKIPYLWVDSSWNYPTFNVNWFAIRNRKLVKKKNWPGKQTLALPLTRKISDMLRKICLSNSSMFW